MDPSALERSINSLDTSLGRWGVFIVAMTALVGVGLILECLYEIPEAIKERREKKNWKPLLIIAGVVFITVGVLGEFVGEYEAGDKETQLRKANDQLEYALAEEVKSAQANAKEAAIAAGDAQSSAGQARIDASVAKSLANSAKFDVADVARQTSDLQVQAKSLQEDIATAEAEEQELEAKVAWRTISDEQRAKLKDVLEREPNPKPRVDVDCFIADSEACFFAQKIANALNAAGWESNASLDVQGLTVPGLFFAIQEGDFPPYTDVLERAFAAAQIPIQRAHTPTLPIARGAAEIVVGHRPEPVAKTKAKTK
jgi:hypothetical protein